jgi:RNA polymerase sigma factor (sigma-70 family)
LARRKRRMAAPLPDNDADLVLLAVDGDEAAFSALYERYFPSVHDFLTRLLRSREEAADVAQDTFIKAFEQLSTLEKPDRFKSWLFTIAHRSGLNRIRSAKWERSDGAVDDQERATMAVADADPTVDPEQMAEIQEAADIVWEAAAGLDPRTYTVMDLHVRQGLGSAEIADVMGVSRANAYTMVSRMKRSFSNTLATYLLFRKGSRDCDGLARIISAAGEDLTPEIRKTVDRHINACAVCSENKVLYLEPLKLFASLILVPVPAGLQASIWGPVAATAGVGAADAAAGTAAAEGEASATAAAGSSAAATTTTLVTVAGTAVVATVLAVGGWLAFGDGADDGPGDGPGATASVAAASDAAEQAPGVDASPDPSFVAAPSGGAPSTPTTDPASGPPPIVVAADTVNVDEDGTVTIDVLANDSGLLDAGSLAVEVSPSNGQAVAGSGDITYTPAPDFAGTDRFTYSVGDTNGQTGTGTVTITVDGVADPPVVPGPGVLAINEDGTVAFDPLAGATDADGDALTLASFDRMSAAGGTIRLGSLVYTPPPEFSGRDTFSYTVTDGRDSVTLDVMIEVAAVPDPPVRTGADPSWTVPTNSTTTLDLLAGWSDPDGDGLEVVEVTIASTEGGSLLVDADGNAAYTPAEGFVGMDGFTYTVTDGSLTATAVASITVVGENQSPLIGDAEFKVAGHTEPGFVIGVVEWSDPDGDTVTFEPVTVGAIAVSGDGTVIVVAEIEAVEGTVIELETVASDGRSPPVDVTVVVEIRRGLGRPIPLAV